MEPEELESLSEFALERQREQVWGNQGELLAQQVELLHAILSRLNAGIGVAMTAKLGKPGKPYESPRPPWARRVKSDEKVMTPREFFAAMLRR